MSNLPGTSPYRPNLGAAVEITQSMSVALPAGGVNYLHKAEKVTVNPCPLHPCEA